MNTIELGEGQYKLVFDCGIDDFFFEKKTGGFAVEALKSTGEKHLFRPLVMVGEHGTGKTHLLRGFVGDYSRLHSDEGVRMLPVHEFTAEMVQSIKSETTKEFEDQYCNLGLLVIDDMMELAGKKATQEELGYIVNKLVLAGGIVVLLFEKMQSAFTPLMDIVKPTIQSGGILCDIRYPEEECRRNFAYGLKAAKGLSIPDYVASIFAKRLPSISMVRAAMSSYILANGSRSADEILALYTPQELPAEPKNQKRATSDNIDDFAQPYILNDNVGPFIPHTETSRLMSDLMKEFTGIYCAVIPDKAWGQLFTVRSTSTRHFFLKIRVK